MNADPSISAGLSISETVYHKCHDGIGVTLERREVACKEFQRITGIRIEPRDTSPNFAIISGVAISALIMGIIIGYTLSNYGLVRFGRKRKKNSRRK